MSVATMSRQTKKPILGYVSKNYKKKNSGSKGLKKTKIFKFV